MSIHRSFQKAYQSDALSTQVLGADALGLVVLLYEGAIEALDRARVAIENSDFQTKSMMLNKALDIIEGLRSSLNFERGGDVAVNLNDLYDFMLRELFRSTDADEQKKSIIVVRRLMDELLDAWKTIAKNNEAKQALNRTRDGGLSV